LKAVAHLRLVLYELASALTDGPWRFREGDMAGGSLHYHGTTPVLRLRGTPYEMGFAHGRLLGQEIRRLADAYLDRFFRSYASVAAGSVYEPSERMAAFVSRAHREEIRGLADGAGMPEREALLFQTFIDIHKTFACSTVVGRTRAGRTVFGRTLDFPSMGLAHRYGLVVVRHAPDARPVASVSWPGLLGTLSGMNDTGLTIAVMVVYFVEDQPEGIPYSLLYREILEAEDGLDGVERRLRAARNTNSNNLTVATGDGDAAVFEIRPSAVERRGGAFVCSTNHFTGGGRRPFTWHPLYLSSYARRWRLGTLRTPSETVTRAEVLRAVRAVAPPLSNLQAMLFHPEARSMEVAMGRVPAARGRFERLEADVLFEERR
jgi:hypothetical protein